MPVTARERLIAQTGACGTGLRKPLPRRGSRSYCHRWIAVTGARSAGSGDVVNSAVVVFCVACKSEAEIHSRSEFSAFDDYHRAVCDTRVVLHRSTLDELLDLPPHATIDLTRYEPAWVAARSTG